MIFPDSFLRRDSINALSILIQARNLHNKIITDVLLPLKSSLDVTQYNSGLTILLIPFVRLGWVTILHLYNQISSTYILSPFQKYKIF